jgi:hypothetical protein
MPYLDAPVTNKEIHDGSTSDLSYGLASMQVSAPRIATQPTTPPVG